MTDELQATLIFYAVITTARIIALGTTALVNLSLPKRDLLASLYGAMWWWCTGFWNLWLFGAEVNREGEHFLFLAFVLFCGIGVVKILLGIRTYHKVTDNPTLKVD